MLARLLSVTLTGLTLLALAGSPAHAQWDDRRGGHDDGYRDGAQAGADDARGGRPFEYERHRDYREADRGYDRREGPRDRYQEQYRAGYVAGYRDAYYSSGGRGAGAAMDRRPPLPGFGPRPGYRNGPAFGPRSNLGRAPLVDIAESNGFDDGYEKGLEDGRDGDRADPGRHSRYRNADQGYRRDYGPRSVYQQAYRAAFEQGYERGYREARERRRRR